MVTRRWKRFDDTFSRLDRIPACERQTDTRTNGQRSCHGIVRAVHTRRALKTIFNMAGGILLPCNVAGWDDVIEIARWQHPAMWHVALGVWDDMPLNSPKRSPYWNSTSGFDFDHISVSLQSTCHSALFGRKNDVIFFWRWRISAILDFIGAIVGSLISPCTSYRSSIETIA